MTRYVNEDLDWDYARQTLWDNAVNRATGSVRGQRVLRELEAALLALPEPKLIEGLICDGAAVCAVGALAAHRKVATGLSWAQAFGALDESSDYDYEESGSVDDTARYAEKALKMAFSLAWDVAYQNDHVYGHLTPEERWSKMLAWVRARIKPEAVHA